MTPAAPPLPQQKTSNRGRVPDVSADVAKKLLALQEKQRQKEEAAVLKKEGRAQAARERDEQKAIDKAEREKTKQVESQCQKALSKVGPIVAKMEKNLADNLLGSVPKHIVSEAKSCLTAIKQILIVANEHCDGSALRPQDKTVLEGLDEKFPQAEVAQKALGDFLITCAKHSRA